MGPNVIRFEFVMGKPHHGDEERYFVVGCYIPPSDKDGTTRRLIEQTMLLKPKRATPIIMGDLNARLEVPWDCQEELLSDLVGTWGYSASLEITQCAQCHAQTGTLVMVAAADRRRRGREVDKL